MICFSPHPDDDVISMGGILRKLTQNGNEITVAYMTSGNIAVFDHDVRRYVDFLRAAGARPRHRTARTCRRSRPQVRRVPRDEAAGRRGHRRGAGHQAHHPRGGGGQRASRRSASARAHARFLNLPFYQTGKVRKDPIGPADVAIVRALLEEIAPELIFVAGDLSDPHGTHRMCKEAIDRALAEYVRRRPPPEVWLYRGAWQEWPVTEATWLVPLSQEELRLKIQAIFKHQSPEGLGALPRARTSASSGSGSRRATRRPRRMLDRLGLAEYFAMEAYVVA